MKCYTGVDLGSTTTKAIVLDEEGEILGRGITNSRSNYDTAVQVAIREALTDVRLTLLGSALSEALEPSDVEGFLEVLERGFRREQFLADLTTLERTLRGKPYPPECGYEAALDEVFTDLRTRADALFEPGAERRSDFFRDLAGSIYFELAEQAGRAHGCDVNILVNLFDRSIIEVENDLGEMDVDGMLRRSLDVAVKQVPDLPPETLRGALDTALRAELNQDYTVGTGYGRARLPFGKEHIRSEILCHGLGAHIMFPGTRTVLDIGGQDTKAIQIDENGIVEGFQMNDRCAAGCGRYLGYIADEMQLGLHELGPLAMEAKRCIKINSTCTVFAGAELRDRLALGERREDVLAGLHRAIVLRAVSLLSRSGGVRDEFTFTGGVAKNEAVVAALQDIVGENYDAVTLNIAPDSIFTGALGAATFARRAARKQELAA